jgi:hypothetical protein
MSGQAQRGQVASRCASSGVAALLHLVPHPRHVTWDAGQAGCWVLGCDMCLLGVVGDGRLEASCLVLCRWQVGRLKAPEFEAPAAWSLIGSSAS